MNPTHSYRGGCRTRNGGVGCGYPRGVSTRGLIFRYIDINDYNYNNNEKVCVRINRLFKRGRPSVNGSRDVSIDMLISREGI